MTVDLAASITAMALLVTAAGNLIVSIRNGKKQNETKSALADIREQTNGHLTALRTSLETSKTEVHGLRETLAASAGRGLGVSEALAAAVPVPRVEGPAVVPSVSSTIASEGGKQ